MAVTVAKLFDSIKKNEIKLLAGKDGLNRVVRWVHMVESCEITTFLEGDEMAFITGVGLENQNQLLDLVKEIIKHHGSAIVINVGPFIKEIPENVIEYCKQKQIPLFLVPWHICMATIMHQFCFMITTDEKSVLEIAAAINNAIYFPKQKELYLPHLESHGLKEKGKYVVVLLDGNFNDPNQKYVTLSKVCQELEDYAAIFDINVKIIEHDDYYLMLFIDYKAAKVRQLLGNMQQNSDLLLQKPLIFSMGQEIDSLTKISQSYYQANNTLILKKHQGDQKVVAYDDLGIYKLILAIEDKEVLKSFYQEVIGELLLQDSLSHNDLCDVLRCYLDNNGSVRDTAEKFYIHRNTVIYKMHKIEEILNCDLSKLETRMLLDIALKVYDVYSQL